MKERLMGFLTFETLEERAKCKEEMEDILTHYDFSEGGTWETDLEMSVEEREASEKGFCLAIDMPFSTSMELYAFLELLKTTADADADAELTIHTCYHDEEKQIPCMIKEKISIHSGRYEYESERTEEGTGSD